MLTALRWVFFLTQIGILMALVFGAMLMARLSRKLDRDQGDRELLRAILMRESDTARAAVEGIDPTNLVDRRKQP